MTDRQTHGLPVTIRAVFQDLLLVTYAVPPAALAALLPPVVHPYVRDGTSYVSVVVANIRGMRPGPVPAVLGTNYYQVVYRAVVELRTADGRVRPGVFFLRSDGNDPVMSFFGNRLTEFRFHYFHTGAIGMFARGDDLLVTAKTRDEGGDLVLHLTDDGPADRLRPVVGFADVDDERRTLVQLFHAFAYNPDRRVVYDLEIERGEWDLRRLRHRDGFAAFFAERPFALPDPTPAAAVHIRQCAYVWKPVVAIPEAELV